MVAFSANPVVPMLIEHQARRRVNAVVSVDQSYAGFGDRGAIAMEHAAGTLEREGVVRVRSRDGVTLIFNDLLFNPPARGFAGLLYRALNQGTSTTTSVPWRTRSVGPGIEPL